MTGKDPATAAAETAARELAKVAYEDLLQPAAREVGAELGEFARAIMVAGRGFGYLIRETYAPFVLRALNKVPTDRRIPPSPPLLGQVLEGISYETSDSPVFQMFEALLELLSTVHWVVKQEGVDDPDEIRRHLARWSERKRMFTREQVVVALEALGEQGWLTDVKISA